MSVTFVKLRGRVRQRLHSLDGRIANPDSVALDMALCDAYIALQADLPAPTLYTASGLTISAGTDLFTLPVTITSSGFGTGTVEYAGQVDIQLQSNGQWLERKTQNELLSWITNAGTLLGVPTIFALYQDGSQTVRGRCYPGAKTAQVCNIYTTIAADDLRDYVGTGGTEGLDTATAPLSRKAAAALVARASANLVARMDEAALKSRGINPNVAKLWMDEANDLAYQAAGDMYALESNGETQRRVP